jgi:pectinesterase
MKRIILVSLVFIASLAFAEENANLIVAKDGSANYRTIQDALNAVPVNNQKTFTILVKNGIYNEKLFFTRNNVAIVGENRDSTRIIFAELRKNWLAQKGNGDYGSAVINIDSTANDITIANLTVHNNYGSLYGNRDHQYAIRGFGTRIIILNCNIIADGADTIALWNTNSLSYHSNCYFEGWVDYVCPRGWCYITDSKFFGHNLTASLWHRGEINEDQKLVIRDSYFDGVPGFPLGRHHRDAQFYLLDCIFSENMADVPIFWPVSPNAKEWIWGARHYFYNCHRIGGDYKWFKNNLETADGSPEASGINAKWTFAGLWDPENTLPKVLPFVSLPQPRNGEYNVSIENVFLKWIPSRNAVSHNVYFWKSKFPQALDKGEKLLDGPAAAGEPVFVKNQNENIFSVGILEQNGTYYWRIDELMKDGSVVTGTLWHFTTKE